MLNRLKNTHQHNSYKSINQCNFNKEKHKQHILLSSGNNLLDRQCMYTQLQHQKSIECILQDKDHNHLSLENIFKRTVYRLRDLSKSNSQLDNRHMLHSARRYQHHIEHMLIIEYIVNNFLDIVGISQCWQAHSLMNKMSIYFHHSIRDSQNHK